MIDYLFRIAYFVEQYEELNTKIEVANLFGYDDTDGVIYITDEKDELDVAWDVFMLEYLKNEFDLDLRGKGEYVMELYSLLHEIGHSKTIEWFDYDEYEKEADKLPDEDFLAYRQLYGEYIADDWAVTFIKNHPEILDIK